MIEHTAHTTAALQGAFAEHQVMLQKLSLKKRVVIVLVRQQEDLDKCDALIIPGGGNQSLSFYSSKVTHPDLCAHLQSRPRSRSWRVSPACLSPCASS